MLFAECQSNFGQTTTGIMRVLRVLLAAAVSVLPINYALADTIKTINGVVNVGSLDSSVGDYVFMTKSAIGDAIFSSCKMGDACIIEAYVSGEKIKAIVSVKAVKAPPPSDAVYDTRSACLYGSMEGEKLSSKDRITACDELGSLEAQALEAGYCWNQIAGEYRTCE
ncbi:hypothetical protein J2T09_002490 [Neorhizobium huautlense]|uniref:Uncharacterized protein n=1 Tax=Neorhizobium huautlense TaxID=67774 RepID=A0ABT9PTC9_9HYPH|nr:hypothetical protein [Neorhizobium huautlense]MDP9837733.1 hypothetical protein [Neorhizobium huautlense]